MSVDAEGAVDVARRFVDAVAWGEHHLVWELLGSEGRHAVLRVATARGMDEVQAARLREGTAAPGDRERFLADLVNGLRADLAGADLDAVEYVPDPAPEPGRARVMLVAPLPPALETQDGLPFGSVELAEEDGAWRVQRLLPRPGRWPG